MELPLPEQNDVSGFGGSTVLVVCAVFDKWRSAGPEHLSAGTARLNSRSASPGRLVIQHERRKTCCANCVEKSDEGGKAPLVLRADEYYAVLPDVFFTCSRSSSQLSDCSAF
jgi:hypothetical protein